jgi:hypothetical protein
VLAGPLDGRAGVLEVEALGDRWAWLIALSISCWSSLLTMSNDESAMDGDAS